MIPERIGEFLRGLVVMHTAARDADLQPCISRAFGARVEEGEEDITFYIPQQRSEPLVDGYRKSGRVALVAANITNFETYQFKGRFNEARPLADADLRFQDAYLNTIQEAMVRIGYPREMVSNWNYWVCRPGLAVRFAVEDIFFQTPGPGTGNSITQQQGES